jgi:hypothetical protein
MKYKHLYLLYAAIQCALLPILFPFDFYIAVFSLIILIANIAGIYYLHKKKQVTGLVFHIGLYAEDHENIREIFGIMGLTTIFWGFIMSLFIIGYASRYVINNDTFANFAFFMLIILIFQRDLSIKIWRYCSKAAARIKNLYVLGIIFPFILELILGQMIGALVIVTDNTVPLLVVVTIYLRKLFIFINYLKIETDDEFKLIKDGKIGKVEVNTKIT